MRQYHSNLRILSAAYFFSNLMFALGFITPLFMDKGFSPGTIMLSQSFYMLTIMIFEIPSGIVGDVYGQKLCLVISSAAAALAWVCVYFLEQWGIFLYQFFFGIFSAFLSGALDSYLYLFLEHKKAESTFKDKLIQVNSKRFMAMILSGLLGTFLYSLGGYGFLFLFTIAAAIIAIILFISLEKVFAPVDSKEVRSVRRILKEALHSFQESKVKLLAMDSILFGAIIGSFFHLHQVWLKDKLFPVSLNGIYTTAIFLVTIGTL